VKPPTSIDGVSLVPTLLGRPGQAEHEYLYWEFGEVNAGRAVRAGPWKAIQFFAQAGRPAKFELFNLDSDLGETHNVAAERPRRSRRWRT
jgi:arylsulfatase A-like enzyme